MNTLYTPDAIYVADFDNGLVRVVGLDGTTTTLVRQADFSRPFGLARAASGALYVQTDNAPGGAHSTTTGTIWRIDAGSHAAVALATNLGRPRGLAMLPDGRIAMADYLHHVVEVLDPATGVTTILAGTFDASGYLDATGAAARFARPYGVAVRDGALIVADYENHRIRSVDLATRAVTTLAGTGTAGTADGAAADAQFDLPQGVAVDAAGTIYVTDTGSFRIRRIRGTTVDTIAGDGIGGFRDADDPRAAAFWGLEGLAVRPDGAALYVADGSRGEDLPYHRVRVVDLSSQEDRGDPERRDQPRRRAPERCVRAPVQSRREHVGRAAGPAHALEAAPRELAVDQIVGQPAVADARLDRRLLRREVVEVDGGALLEVRGRQLEARIRAADREHHVGGQRLRVVACRAPAGAGRARPAMPAAAPARWRGAGPAAGARRSSDRRGLGRTLPPRRPGTPRARRPGSTRSCGPARPTARRRGSMGTMPSNTTDTVGSQPARSSVHRGGQRRGFGREQVAGSARGHGAPPPSDASGSRTDRAPRPARCDLRASVIR